MAEAPRLEGRALLKAFSEAGVDFVVIGGVALALQGSDRNTKDLDLTYRADRDNLERLGGVLVELGAKLRGVDDAGEFIPDRRTLAGTQLLTLETPLGLLDVLASPTGAPRYQTLAKRAEKVDLGGFTVLVASIDHLIAMKEAAGRPQDLAAVEELKAIRRLRRGDPPRDSLGRTAAEVLRELRSTGGNE